jgi:flagellar M-ring protein FliF
MNELVKRVSDPFMALSPLRRWTVAGVVLLSFVGFGILITLSNKIEYKPLFANLGPDDAGEIAKKLKEQKIQYKIAADGKAILVPADKVYELRLSLAAEGLPQGGGVGFEIFDRKNFGMTEFVQKLNYQRALQGELSRTIMQLAEVEKARVHLVIPEKSLFKENEKPPTASVVLQIKSGHSLRESSVAGITHLVASAVEGMDLEQVTVLDNRGKVLNNTGPSDAAGKLTATMMETQKSYEKNLEDRLQTLLDKAVGSGKSVARVTALLDFKQVERVEERYDPNSAVVRSQQRSEQKDSTPAVPASGVPGVQTNTVKGTANLPTPQPPVIPPVAGSKNDETLNYEVNRSSSKIVEPVGALAKISVAIMVDGKIEPGVPGKNGQPGKPKYVARTADELQKIEALVKSAVGFSGDRGDQVTVVNVPFQETGEDAPADTSKWWEQPYFMDLARNGLLGLGFLALLLLVVRPMLKMLMPQPEPASRLTIEPLSLDVEQEQQGQLPGPADPYVSRLGLKSVSQMELLETVTQEPYQAAQILQTWLRQPD